MSTAKAGTTDCFKGCHIGPARSRQLPSSDGSTKSENYCKNCLFAIDANDLASIIRYEVSIGVDTTLGFKKSN